MGAFEFQALDASGRTQKGVLQGDTARAVRQLLRERGLTPVAVVEVADAAKDAAPGLRLGRRGLSASQKAILTRQFATLIRAGLPLDEALTALAEQSDGETMRRQLVSIRSRMMEGQTLASSLAGFPESFDAVYCAAVAAGEGSGKLSEVLEQLADYGERQASFAQKLGTALVYPVLLLTLALGVTAALLGYVVPKVMEVFTDLDAELPLPTRILLGLADAIERWGALGVGALVVAGVLAALALRRPAIRARWDRFLLGLPVIGKLLTLVESARLARTMAIATSAAVPVLEALKLSSRVLSNTALKSAVETAALRVREGASLSGALKETGRFPQLLVRLIASGEKSGELPRMVAHAADLKERQVQDRLATAVALIEPLMILGMGLVVLFIVLAILLPIFNLNQLLGVAP